MAKESKDEKPLPESVTRPLPREKLPSDLQKLIDRQDDWYDQLYEGQGPDSTETTARYAAYANRLRTIMVSAHRYVAYTSDVGESFRPIAHPWLVRSAYGISWAYLIGDVSNEGWKAYKRNQRLLHPEDDQHKNATQPMVPGVSPSTTEPVKIPAIEDYRSVMAERAVFQSIASMGLPAFTIHSVVKYSGKALKNAANTTIRTWGPIGLGLAVVPALPFLFDKPVEEAVEWTFYQGFKTLGGDGAVRPRPSHGRNELLQEEAKKGKIKEKEL